MKRRKNSSKTKTVKKESVVHNRHLNDNAAKLIFKDPILCAEFLRGYTGLELLKEVQPEDIEDLSERFLPLFQEGRDSDTVKKIRIGEKEEALYLIAIVEHQSEVVYDMSLKMLRYIVMVLTDYEREQEKRQPGITGRKEYKYPPVLPIIYYEGRSTWTAAKNFREKVHFNDVLAEYIPSFEYILVPLSSYSQDDLVQKQDTLSLVLLLNKLKESTDFKNLKGIPKEYFDDLEQNTPKYLLELIGEIIAAFLYRMNVPRQEVETFVDQIERRNFSKMFESFEAYDVQEVRRISKMEAKAEAEAKANKEIAKAKDETAKANKESRKREIAAVLKMLNKSMDRTEIRDILDIDLEYIARVEEVAQKHPDKSDLELSNIIYAELYNE